MTPEEYFGYNNPTPGLLNAGDVADFTWDFGCQFFLETAKGNYVWNDPDYGGDNTIRPYNGTYQEWIGKGQFGRGKGKHFIGQYCGDQVKFLEE